MTSTIPPEPVDKGSTLRATYELSKVFGRQRWLVVLVIMLGTAVALAETLSVGLAVMLLFAILDQGGQILAAGGVLALLYTRLVAIVGTSPPLIGAAFFGLILCQAALSYANEALLGVTLNRLAERMRDVLHARLVTTPYRVIQKRDPAALMHSLGTETWNVSDAYLSVARMAVDLCAMTVFAAGMVMLSWKVAVIAVAGGIVSLGLLRRVMRPAERLSKATLSAHHSMAHRMLVSLTGMRTLRVFAREEDLLHRFGEASRNLRAAAARMELLRALSGPLSQVLGAGILILVALSATWMNVDPALVIAEALLLLRLQPYLTDFLANRVALQASSAAIREMNAALGTFTTMPETGSADWPDRGPGGEIRFENVTFSHTETGLAELRDLNFSIPLDGCTLIDGPSGSGKTTVLNLLLRLYQPDAGRITVKGVDLLSLSRELWLRRMSVAGQDVELIEGTVGENIRFGRPDAPSERMSEICEAVEILDVIEALPQGFDTPIGAAGSSLSGGQRQRLGLARALIRDPEILILDESMSALEPEREDRIHRRIRDLMAGRTLILVSHRPEVRKWADRIVTLRGTENHPFAVA
ncbi:ABC transporter ATP-binding protein [Paracoccus sp. MBLB3053]|uniref:ABC transporter ATP-binding protein n=1 Tax=Paracoccus aurantius TaxID=3073814 RepID=A0ABU2HYB3_9RHOB|nr:ABC transporter ATP-binding protein [Paracoccus sp. MBLB3053]MDS9470054.1 ABC transporter ATP-binding protein [Paracoccus sp. MBLB3053]